mgnify:CR=1 FL=1
MQEGNEQQNKQKRRHPHTNKKNGAEEKWPATLSIKQIIQKLQENGSQWGTSTIRTLLDRLVKRKELEPGLEGETGV